jgi:uncharacterized protein YcbK (DUF882 family)
VSYCRRRFLKLSILSLLATLKPLQALGAVSSGTDKVKHLNLFNIHTRESVSRCYCDQGQYVSRALDDINWLMRDHRTNEVRPIDPQLLDLLHTVSLKFPTPPVFHIISGYRSPATNARLRRESGKVAQNSFHMYGKAVDLRLPGYTTRNLRKDFVRLQSGGVGYYGRSDFIHIDTGPVRFW